MSILDRIAPSAESKGFTTVGKAEATKENISEMFMGIMSSMGLVNPSAITSTSSKAVTITKKGNVFVITLNHYDPPLTFTWTGLLPTERLLEIITKLTEDKKRINYVNKVTTSKGKFVQLGIS